MGATDSEKAKLVKRLNRIPGQVDALQRALEAEAASAASDAAEQLIGIVHSYLT